MRPFILNANRRTNIRIVIKTTKAINPLLEPEKKIVAEKKIRIKLYIPLFKNDPSSVGRKNILIIPKKTGNRTKL